jgi:hypothetical protein
MNPAISTVETQIHIINTDMDIIRERIGKVTQDGVDSNNPELYRKAIEDLKQFLSDKCELLKEQQELLDSLKQTK